jgi:predicted AlkP superfamily phosphohydrolase/phosphomutase
VSAASRVILFGLDGATYTVLDDLVQRGVMPFFGEFTGRGTRATLRSTVPPLTPPAWTSMVTGRSPGHHGIHNFMQFESPSSRFNRVVTTRQLRCETIWSIAARQGRRAGCLNFVAHNPPPRIDGFVIPGWMTWRWIRNQSHPGDIINQLKEALPNLDLKELGMDFTEEQKAVHGAELDDYDAWVDLHIRRERQWFDILRHQLKHDTASLVGIVFDGVDKLQHLLWSHLDPALAPENPSPSFLRIRKRCDDYFRQIDAFLAETVELAGPDGNVFVVSDHGFCGTSETLYINAWLAREGYLTWNDSAVQADADSHRLGVAHQHLIQAIDLERTTAYADTASSNGIHIVVRGVRGPHGIPLQDYNRFRAELIGKLQIHCVNDAGQPLVRRVWTREEIFAGESMDVAPDLTLELHDHGFFSTLCSSVVSKHRPVPVGTHHPDGILVAAGPGIVAQRLDRPLRMIDVAPTLLHALGLPIPADLEGHVVTDLYPAEFVRRNPVQEGPATRAPGTAAVAAKVKADQPDTKETVELNNAEEEQLTMRLRALGYLE